MMRSLPDTQEFRDLAARIVWFEPPETALSDVPRFMAYAFRYASHDDMRKLRTKLTDDDLRAVLANAPTGIIDPRSWSYWHAMLGTFPPPNQPTRNLDPQPPRVRPPPDLRDKYSS